jgi:hypothetical protein
MPPEKWSPVFGKGHAPPIISETDNIVLEHLRHIRGAVDGPREDMREVEGRLGILEHQYASLSNRLDRMDGRIERIEQRLSLVAA